MKLKFVFNSLTLFILFTTCCNAQEIPDPEFSLRPYFVKGNLLENLERADASVETKLKALGYGGAEAFFAVMGLKSSVRFQTGALPTIIIKTEDNSDPADIVVITKAEFKKDKRRFKAAKVAAFGVKPKNISDSQVKISFKKVREKLFQLIFEGPLPPGEYALLPTHSSSSAAGIKISCFGVD